VAEFTPTHLKAEVNASGQHLLVFSQIYYPGWQAQIDGQPVELYRVNVIQQGVVVPAGAHTVELIFSPRSFWVGLTISVMGLFIGLVLFYLRRSVPQMWQKLLSSRRGVPQR
jgi:uncharacterized membrane protein YfhO